MRRQEGKSYLHHHLTFSDVYSQQCMAINSSVCSHFFTFVLMMTGAFSRNISRVTFQALLVKYNLTLYLAKINACTYRAKFWKVIHLATWQIHNGSLLRQKTENHHGTLTTQDIPLFMRIKGPIASGGHFPKSNWDTLEDEPGNMANLPAGSWGALRHDLVTLRIAEKITDVNYWSMENSNGGS